MTQRLFALTFIVQQWQAIDRLLWSVAVAYTLLQFARSHPMLQGIRAAAIRVLHWWGVLGRRLTVGKLAEAIILDVHHHPRAGARVGAREIAGNWSIAP